MASPHAPLDINGRAVPAAPAKEKKVSYMSLPNKGQLAILCIARLADPLAAASIQSYMFYQLKFFDPTLSDASISVQAGILVGAKTASQVCTGMLWGRFADSDWGGRKTVLMIGLLSCCISYIGYGLARSFVMAVFWQVFGGAMSSNVAIVRCVVAELNPEKRYRTRALLLLPLAANSGMLLGPLVGGLLSMKAGDDGSLHKYPYAPPNLFAAAIYITAATGVFFGLKETLEGHNMEESLAYKVWQKIKSLRSRTTANGYSYEAIGANEAATPTSPIVEMSPTSPSSTPLINKPPKRKRRLPFWRIWTVNVIFTMLAHFIISGHLGTFSNLWAIFLSTPVDKDLSAQKPPLFFNGGLGMQPRDVGFAMSLLGAIGVVLQMAIYPMLNDRFGALKIWRAALFIFPIVYILAPFPSLVASHSSVTALIWLAMAFILLLFVIGRTGVTPATTLIINDCTPHPSARGTIHTAGTVVGNLSRSLFPVMAFAIFGKGLQIRVVGLGFWCLACLAMLACVASRWVREGGNGTEIVLEDESEDEAEVHVGTEASGHANGYANGQVNGQANGQAGTSSK